MHFTPRITHFALPFATLAVLLFAPASNVVAQDRASLEKKLTRTLTLSAIGSIESKPDMASITTGVQSEAPRARDALDDNNDDMAKIMTSLNSAGLQERDITTTQFSVQPRYQHFKNGRAAKVIGYRVTNSLRITARNLEQLGSILDRLVTLGSNRISGISFGLSDPDKAMNAARKEAMRKALDKAELYAKAAQVTLGPITSISEKTRGFSPRPMAMRSARSMAAVPIAPGQHTTKVTVHVTWALVE